MLKSPPISQPLPKSWTPSSSLLWLILHTPAPAIFPLSPLITSFIMPGLLGLPPTLPPPVLISCPPSPAPITNPKLVLQLPGTKCPLGPQHCPSAHNVLPYSQGLDSYVTFSCKTFLPVSSNGAKSVDSCPSPRCNFTFICGYLVHLCISPSHFCKHPEAGSPLVPKSVFHKGRVLIQMNTYAFSQPLSLPLRSELAYSWSQRSLTPQDRPFLQHSGPGTSSSHLRTSCDGELTLFHDNPFPDQWPFR